MKKSYKEKENVIETIKILKEEFGIDVLNSKGFETYTALDYLVIDIILYKNICNERNFIYPKLLYTDENIDLQCPTKRNDILIKYLREHKDWVTFMLL